MRACISFCVKIVTFRQFRLKADDLLDSFVWNYLFLPEGLNEHVQVPPLQREVEMRSPVGAVRTPRPIVLRIVRLVWETHIQTICKQPEITEPYNGVSSKLWAQQDTTEDFVSFKNSCQCIISILKLFMWCCDKYLLRWHFSETVSLMAVKLW